MALVLADRVQETSTSVGTGTFTLAGAVNGFQSFAVIGNGNTTYYVIAGGNEWEVGIGTYTSSGTTLSRDTVLSSSNSNAKVDFSAGVKYVFVSYPEERAVYVNGSSVVIPNSATIPIANGGTGATTLAAANIPELNVANTFTGANTFRTTSGTRFEEAATQDAIVIDGRAGGTSSYAITLTPATLASNTTLTLPNVTSTVAALGATQTFSAAQTFSNAVTFSGTTTNIALGTSQTSGTWTAGGASQTGTITLDQSTKAHTLNIGTGATENATTKTINFGTNGVSGSTTNITIGSATGNTTTQIQGATLGGTATNSSLLGQFYGNVGNGSYLRIFTYRHTTGADWTGVSTRIQQRIDVTDQGWIEFNPSGNQYGVSINATSGGLVSLNTNGSARVQVNSSGAVGFGGANYGTAGQILTSNGSSSAPSWQTSTAASKGFSQIMSMVFGL